MTLIKTLLGFLSMFGVLTKWLPSIGAISGFFGPVGPMIAAVLTFVVQVVKWFFDGLTAMLSNPVTFITAGVFMACAFLGGVKYSKEKYEAALARKDQVITKMISDGNKVDADKKAKLGIAVDKAKEAEKASAETVVAKPASEAPIATTSNEPAPAVAKRVRRPSEGKSPSQIGGSSVPWFQSVFGAGIKN